MKFITLITHLLVLLLASQPSQAWAACQDYRNLKDDSLIRTLENALEDIDCKIKCADGIGSESAKHQQKNPKSCHKYGMAIDIHKLDCDNDLSNEENLEALYHELPGYISLRSTVKCYKDFNSNCEEGHDNHLHFGAAQWNGCSDNLLRKLNPKNW